MPSPVRTSIQRLIRSRAGRISGVLLALLLLVPACGGPRAPGGQGSYASAERLLVLEGTPHEMGWWHGHLLRTQILELRSTGLAQLTKRMGGMKGWEQHLDLVVDQTLHRLSERLLQELEGMAAATGLEPEELIRLDVARDALRMKGLDAGLPGAAGLVRTPGGFEVQMRWGGADAAWLAKEGLVIHRKPTGGAETAGLAWPGSIGSLATVAATGRGFALAEVEIRDKRRLGFGGGRPFAIAARESLRTSKDADTLLAATTATMGHLFLGFVAEDGEVGALAGVGAFQGSPDPIEALGERTWFAMGPYDGDMPTSKSVRDAVAAQQDPTPEQLQLLLQLHAPGDAGPRVRIVWRGGKIAFHFAADGGTPSTVMLGE